MKENEAVISIYGFYMEMAGNFQKLMEIYSNAVFFFLLEPVW